MVIEETERSKKRCFGAKNDLDTWFIGHFWDKTQKRWLRAKEKNQENKFVRDHLYERISLIHNRLQVINQDKTGVIEEKWMVK